MKTKQGISLIVLVITTIVMVIIVSITIMGMGNALTQVKKEDFVTELITIKDKAKEYHLLMGSLPVKSGEEYSSDELKKKLSDSSAQTLFENEVISNKDTNNTFFVIDLDKLALETDKRGKKIDDTDIFVIAADTLNVYYLKGVLIESVLRFSTATLVSQKALEQEIITPVPQVSLNMSLDIVKNTNVWTNEISIIVKNVLQTGETLQYSIAGEALKTVADSKVILINESNMTSDEKTAFDTNKTVTVSKLENETIIETKEISISNLDITSPALEAITMKNTDSEDTNVVKITSTDKGGSGIKGIYYDYNTKLLNGIEQPYYTGRSSVTTTDILRFGKLSKDGVITLNKNIKSIIAIAVDNAGNTTNISTYVIDEEYVIENE